MGNCASYPKTKEGKAPEPEPEHVAAEEVKVEQQENNVEAKTEDVVPSGDNSLANLLNEKKEEEKKEEQVEAKEEVKAEGKNEEKPQTEEPKPEIIKEEKPQA